MKQELLFCAELFHLLYPLMDKDKEIYFALDGSAAQGGARAGTLEDSNIPDLFFYFSGKPELVLIEAKVIDNGTYWLSPNQARHWGPSGSGVYKPSGWVATNRERNAYFFWFHEQFLAFFGTGPNASNQMRIPGEMWNFQKLEELAIHLIKRYA